MSESAETSSEDDAARLRAVLQTAVDAIITISERGIIEDANPAAEKLFGYAAAEMVGNNVNMLMPSPYRDEHDGYLASYQQTGEKKIIGFGREVEGRKKDGTTFPAYLAVSEVQFFDRRIFTGFLHDLTEIREAERRLEALNAELEDRVDQRTQQLREAQEQLVRREKLAALGQLSGGVAHEIRNPLGVIKNSAYFMKMNAEQLDEDMQECVVDIDREVDTANRIVSELLDFTRDPEAHREVFAVVDAVSTAVQAARVPSGVSLTIGDIPGDVKVQADRGQIERILTNLIRNAWQAMSGSGDLNISHTPGETLVLSVQDTGTGIEEKDLTAVFEPLFTTKAKGIGLGLAVSRRYAERNGGTLTVESELGAGTTFHLSLPVYGGSE